MNKVKPLKIAKEYIVCSLTKKFGDDLSARFEQYLEDADDEKIWRMLEAFSETLSLNDMFSVLSNPHLRWAREAISAEKIKMTGMNPVVDEITRELSFGALAFRDYLEEYFSKHPKGKIAELDMFRPTKQPILYPEIIVHARDDGYFYMLDGSHRLIEMLLAGQEECTAYVCHGDTKTAARRGPSTFRNLRLLFEKTRSPAILATTKQFMDDSTDGRDWVEMYWIEHTNKDFVQAAGADLLRSTQGNTDTTIKIVTGNADKFREMAQFISGSEQIDINLPEIQETDPEKVIASKLEAARRITDGNIIVEDTSLALNCLNGLPGPLIKWFLRSIGAQGVFELAKKHADFGATARTIVGLATTDGVTKFFSGEIRGQIVAPRGDDGFGWDKIFQPDGSNKTFAEMTATEKSSISMRKIACKKLAQFLASK